MQSYEYIMTVHWYDFGARTYNFFDFHAAFEAANLLTDSPHVAYVTLKRVPRHIPTIEEAFAAWYELHGRG